MHSARMAEDMSSRHVYSLFIALQITVLIFEGLWYIGRAVPLAVLGPVRSLLVAFGDSFLPQIVRLRFVSAHVRESPDRRVGGERGGER